jgi:hypothetical protein
MKNRGIGKVCPINFSRSPMHLTGEYGDYGQKQGLRCLRLWRTSQQVLTLCGQLFDLTPSRQRRGMGITCLFYWIRGQSPSYFYPLYSSVDPLHHFGHHRRTHDVSPIFLESNEENQHAWGKYKESLYHALTQGWGPSIDLSVDPSTSPEDESV